MICKKKKKILINYYYLGYICYNRHRYCKSNCYIIRATKIYRKDRRENKIASP